ncbi:hypothetical protein HDU79_009355 [Rhizoclosmatium sp. JEL0117]|nr:hypothetical protein HDU79_009355 [Rhizoclosmatium sp. JEL0117]
MNPTATAPSLELNHHHQQDLSASKAGRKIAVFEWAASGPTDRVVVTGEFDSWAQSIELEKNADGSLFSAKVLLDDSVQPGDRIMYKASFVVDGVWKTSAANPTQFDDYGNENNVFTFIPTEPVRVAPAVQPVIAFVETVETVAVAAESTVTVQPAEVQKVEPKVEETKPTPVIQNVEAGQLKVVEDVKSEQIAAVDVVVPKVEVVEKKTVESKVEPTVVAKKIVEKVEQASKKVAEKVEQVVAGKKAVEPVVSKESATVPIIPSVIAAVQKPSTPIVVSTPVAAVASPTTPTIKDTSSINSSEKKTSPSLAQRASNLFKKSDAPSPVAETTPATAASASSAGGKKGGLEGLKNMMGGNKNKNKKKK